MKLAAAGVSGCVTLAMALAVVIACGEGSYEPVDGSGVSGRVVMKDRSRSPSSRSSPLPGVRVEIADMGTAEHVLELRADDAGRFTAGLAPGRYTIKVVLPLREGVTTPAIATVRAGKVTKVTLVVESPLSTSAPSPSP